MMNQWQFETILRIVETGAPVLAQELNTSLAQLVEERNQLAKENEDLKAAAEKKTQAEKKTSSEKKA